MPFFLVVKKGRKMSCRRSSGTPGPLSATSIRVRPARGLREGEATFGLGGVAPRRVGRVAQQVDQHLAHQIRVGLERRHPLLDADLERDALGAVGGAEQSGELLGPGGDVDRPAADLRRAADLAVAFDEMHHPVGAAGERLDRGAGVADVGVRAVVGLAHQDRWRCGRGW